eukprot:1179364-Prorocentrum_minimum.AAC.1
MRQLVSIGPDAKVLVGTGKPVVFGCELQETGEIYRQRADGLMGLGISKVSIATQLAQQGIIADAFGLCFGAIEGGGTLILGTKPVPIRARHGH